MSAQGVKLVKYNVIMKCVDISYRDMKTVATKSEFTNPVLFT